MFFSPHRILECGRDEDVDCAFANFSVEQLKIQFEKMAHAPQEENQFSNVNRSHWTNKHKHSFIAKFVSVTSHQSGTVQNLHSSVVSGLVFVTFENAV